MGNTKSQNAKPQKKKTPWLPLIAAVLVILVVAVALFSKDKTADPAGGDSLTLQPGESLDIPLEELSTAARFYPVEVNGTQMEIIALEDASGEIRTAFNTCQICYLSGRGYYEQEGSVLVCQNCGSQFTADQVGVQAGGCNPWPILPEDRTVTGETLSISYDTLDEATQIFADWKAAF